MANLLRGALVGAIALGGIAVASDEATAMPVGDLTPAISADAGSQSNVQNVYWRYGYGWRRPGWRLGYGYGWRRPGWRYGYGWRRPWGWRGWRRW